MTRSAIVSSRGTGIAMKENNVVVCLLLAAVLFDLTSCTFLGGTISWRENRMKIRYIYRMNFDLGTGPCGSGCSATDIGSKTVTGRPFSDTYWTCSVGCLNNVTGSDLNYVVTAVGDNPDWEQGENIFQQRMTDTMFTMSLTIPATLTNGNRITLSTTIDTRVRNDTQGINSSPVAALPPYTGIPFGCVSNVTLPVMDPDGDVVKCRWTNSSECGQGCNELPEAYLDENSCSIYLNATSSKGYTAGHRYRVSVTVEDFPRFPIKLASKVLLPNQPINSIPLQFHINVVPSSTHCKPSITFDKKNFPDNSVASYSFMDFHNHVDFVFPIYISSTRPNTTFVQSFPQMVTTTTSKNHSGNRHYLEVYSKWRPLPQQLGENILCVWGKDHDGVTSRKHCIIGLIADSNECISRPCHGSATCLNLYMKYACSCPPGFRGGNCQEKITCAENPCLNNGSCSFNSTFSCHCNKGFMGNFCQYEKQPCSSFPCKNGGRCSSSRGSYKCMCHTNFLGQNCETFDACHSTPCLNNGTCKNLNGSFVCQCPPGWKGTDCSQDLNECAQSTSMCSNGGTCINHIGSFVCHCKSGWTGNSCTQDIDECSHYSPCHNNGTCRNTPGSFSCTCHKGWMGANCQLSSHLVMNDVNEKEKSLFPLPLLYILAGIILGCLLLGICIYLIFKRYRAKIQPKLKDCHSVESNRRDSKDLQSKSNKNLQRAKAKAKLKPKVKGRVVRQSLEF
ncbi:uncharacterized protein LOC111128890 [Crassostrea virginica]